jgi:molecular chaperone GrpE (heat shock protein)
LGIERDLRRREGLINAKARIVQAKSDLLSRNTSDAAKELAEAIDSLETATQGAKNIDPDVRTKQLAGKLRQIKSELAQGRKGITPRLDGVQKEVDALLNR